MEKKIVYYLLHSIFFVLYVLGFNSLFKYIGMKVSSWKLRDVPNASKRSIGTSAPSYQNL